MQRKEIDMAKSKSLFAPEVVLREKELERRLTAIDIRHIEHSEEWDDAASESLLGAALPRSRSRL